MAERKTEDKRGSHNRVKNGNDVTALTVSPDQTLGCASQRKQILFAGTLDVTFWQTDEMGGDFADVFLVENVNACEIHSYNSKRRHGLPACSPLGLSFPVFNPSRSLLRRRVNAVSLP